MKKLMSFLVLGFALSNLTACEKTKEQFDFSKKAPDEFAVITRAPLEMPSSFELPPPRPGVDRPQESSPEAQAKQALFGTTQTNNNNQLSKGQSAILERTGAVEVNPNIRTQIDTESEQVIKENTSTWNRILGKAGKKIDAPATVVDPIKESERIIGNQKAGKPVTEGKTPTINQ